MCQKNPAVLFGLGMIAGVNGLAAVLHVLFWSVVFIRLPYPWTVDAGLAQQDLIVTFGLGTADLLWSVPSLAIGSIFLWKRLPIGWLAAQMANILWWYSYTFIIFRELIQSQFRPGTILFLPFALFSVWSAWYLWRVKRVFWEHEIATVTPV